MQSTEKNEFSRTQQAIQQTVSEIVPIRNKTTLKIGA